MAFCAGRFFYYLFGFFAVMANIEKYSADKGSEYADEQRPFGGHYTIAVNCSRVGVNRVNLRAVVNDQADSDGDTHQKDKYAKLLHFENGQRKCC